jgi:DDE family transposase
MVDASAIGERFAAVRRSLNERGRRLFAAAEARTAGHGGISAAARATGVARSTIGRGLKDLNDPAALSGEVRRPGGGRHALTATDPTLLDDLRRLLEPATMGDPMRPLRWVSKSHAKLAAALCAMGHQIGKSSIPKLLDLVGYRRQVNRKPLEGSRNPDRDAQFEHINAAAIATQAAGDPVISIDTKKKELIGPYKNVGSDYRPEGCPDAVNVHDFVDAELGKVVPYGVYDIAANAGCVSVGIDNDTAQFSVNSIRRWLELIGRERCPHAERLMITADGGGSNGSRVRLFKVELQKLADETGLTLQVCHFPPGTSSRVDDWRGGGRSRGVAVVRRLSPVAGASVRTVAPFPVAARQTGHADFPHPAFSCVIRPSRSAGRHGDVARRRGRASRRDTRPDIGDTRCLLVRCVAPTSVADAVAHTSAPTCRSAEPALG